MSDAEELQRLSQQVVQLGRSVDSALSAIMDLRLRVASIEGNTAAPGPTRSSGYVNWGASHDVLKTQRWVKLSKIREFIGQMEGLWSFGTGKANLESLPASSNVVAVDEVTRFPQGEAYVNIYSPHVSAELTALKMQSTRPGTGLLQRFNDNCKDDVQTFSSFEEKYQLKWVD